MYGYQKFEKLIYSDKTEFIIIKIYTLKTYSLYIQTSYKFYKRNQWPQKNYKHEIMLFLNL